ncbi:uncharacterized protein LOC110008380 [Amborella trichopoda]|uniref:uncharacterized protein LOC110008380 n=1 Tax=Amborella trichopoda TaxID=13333 RepID=UPI0009BC9405|nr:uncharacterized protein LOC110008380 [Amborella trichopoda]|eukprot:XP_020530969.1 uncharacterized protein LOC110008380 [Amborella trichopoda]
MGRTALLFLFRNGLVCCLVKSPRGKLSLNLGNPLSPRRMATPPKLNQRVATPPYLKQRKMVTLPKHYLELVSFGFHFNPIRKNFMILANFEYPRDETAFWVFDSVFGSWRLLENQPEIQYKNWKISDCVENKFYVFCPIMCYLEIFDVEREEWVGKYLPNLDKLTPIMQEWNGKLSLAHVTGDLQAHIWVLDEAKDWVEVFRQDLGEMGLKDQAIYARFLLGGTFFLSGNDKYVTIDVETGCSKVIPDHRAGLDFNFVRYQPTLCTFKKPSRRRKLKNKEKTH